MAYSTVSLGGVTLDIDPAHYVMLDGRRRGAVHRMLDGSTVFQDRGIDPTDLTIIIDGTLTSTTTLKALWALYRAVQTEYVLIDFKGNQFSVIFTPGINAFHVDPPKGSNLSYNYKITLSVVRVITWFGVTDGYPTTTSGAPTTSINLQSVGDIMYADTPNSWRRLPIGTSGQILAVVGGIPQWSSSGSIVGGGGLPTTGGTMTGAIVFDPSQTFNAANLNITSQAPGDILYADSASSWSRRGIGSTGQVLTVVSGTPQWQTPSTTDTTKLPLAGGVMTGAITFANSQTFDASHLLITSQAQGDLLYAISSTSWGRIAKTSFAGRVLTSTSTGVPTWQAIPSPVVPDSNALQLTGGAMEGIIVFDPSQTFNAANLEISGQQAGDLLYASTSTLFARLPISSGSKVLGISGGNPSWINFDDTTKLPLAGGVMTGVITFSTSQPFTAAYFTSSVATGTPPFYVSSTTLVTNLNADKLDGYDASALAKAGANTDLTSITGLTGNLQAPQNILDINGNKVVAFGYSSTSAKNYATITNADTGSPIIYGATGPEQYAWVRVQGKVDPTGGAAYLDVTTSGINIRHSGGSALTSSAYFRLYNSPNDGEKYIEFIASGKLTSNLQFVLPISYGNSGDVLTSGGNGTLTFSPVSFASAALTGTPTAPTAAVNTSTTQIATTAFVVNQASTSSPPSNGTARRGEALTYARSDHAHPTVDPGGLVPVNIVRGIDRLSNATLDASFMHTFYFVPPYDMSVRYFVQQNAGANGAIPSQVAIWGPVSPAVRGTPITPATRSPILLAKSASTLGGALNTQTLLDLGSRYNLFAGNAYFITYQTSTTAPAVYIISASLNSDTNATVQPMKWVSYGAGQPTYATNFGTIGSTTWSGSWTKDDAWYYNFPILEMY